VEPDRQRTPVKEAVVVAAVLSAVTLEVLQAAQAVQVWHLASQGQA
jgi:hypothetical protein